MNQKISTKDLIARNLTTARASAVATAINNASAKDTTELWKLCSRQILHAEDPFPVHEYCYKKIYGRASFNFVAPIWYPDTTIITSSNIARFMQQQQKQNYQDLYNWSIKQPVEFWNQAIKWLKIKFNVKYSKTLSLTDLRQPTWFIDGKLNIFESCFQATKASTAIVYQDISGAITNISYAELLAECNAIAASLASLGFKAKDAAAIACPMTPKIVACYLAIIKLGGIVVSIADSFSSEQMQLRLNAMPCKIIFTQDVILRGNKTIALYERVRETNVPKAIVLSATNKIQVSLHPQDISFADLVNNNAPSTDTISCNPHDYINILFSSGTTGTPKAIPWDHTSAIKAAIDAHFHQDVQPNNIFCWPTNLGWMMGPWLIFATLINKATLALTDNSPTSYEFINFIATAKVSILGLVPSMVKHWRTEGYLDNAPWKTNIKCFSSSGECSCPEDMFYLIAKSGYKPMIEYCGGTEIAGAYITSTMIQPNILSAFSTPALGSNFSIRSQDDITKISDKGEIVLLPPALGLSRELLNQDHSKVYFPSQIIENGIPLRYHGDAIERLANGYYRLLGRTDDTMNLGGIKISAAEIERTLLLNSEIKETAVIGVSTKNSGPLELVTFVVLQDKEFNISQLQKKLQQSINNKLNPLFKIAKLIKLKTLPRTSSNKIMRRTLRDNYLKNEYGG